LSESSFGNPPLESPTYTAVGLLSKEESHKTRMSREDSENLGFISRHSVKEIKHYYSEYVSDCQKWGDIPASMTAWVVDRAIRGHLQVREQKKEMLKKELKDK
jgi:hypothetical protein